MAREDEKRRSSAREARGAEIILRTRTERIVFIAGLAAAVTFGVFVALLGVWAPHV